MHPSNSTFHQQPLATVPPTLDKWWADIADHSACFYTRAELGKRMAAWYSMVAVSGAFSGLLAFGLFQVKSSLKGWQLLFLLEGGLTLVLAVGA